MAIDPARNSLSPVCVWALTPNGFRLAQKIQCHLQDAHIRVSSSLLKDSSTCRNASGFDSLSRELADQFSRYRGHVFIFAAGIAVRLLAPLIVSKVVDPCVVVLDDQGRYAISLLSGHLGGGNDFTGHIAEIIGARPVITTATDVNQLPAIDTIARDLDLRVENPEAIKTVNMAVLNRQAITVYDPGNTLLPVLEPLPVRPVHAPEELVLPAVCCSDMTYSVPRGTLLLRPGSLFLGIGCNRGTSMEEIRSLIETSFNRHGLSLFSIAGLSSVDIKQDEPGLGELARYFSVSIRFFSPEELGNVTTIENPSEVVHRHLGVYSVCEASAILSSQGRLILPKTKSINATLAVARSEPACP